MKHEDEHLRHVVSECLRGQEIGLYVCGWLGIATLVGVLVWKLVE